MTEDSNDKEYLELFKPKADQSPDDSTLQGATPGAGMPPAPGVADAEPVPGEFAQVGDDPSGTQSVSLVSDDLAQETLGPGFGPLPATPGGAGVALRSVGLVAGAGCLLLVLTAVVVFAFYQVFRSGKEGGDVRGTQTPTLMPTKFVVFTPSPTEVVAESLLIVPLVSSDDVQVPVALPERLQVGETIFAVQAVNAPAGTWPDAPASGEFATWAYGTVVNYILALASTPQNIDLMSTLQVEAPLSLHMSTGLVLNFNVDEIAVGATDPSTYLEQVSPRLTLLLPADDPAQSTVVTATFFDDEAGEETLLTEAVAGAIGTPMDQGVVRVTVIEAYHVAAAEAGLPSGTGYLLVDLSVQNLGAQVLETAHFQTFVRDAAGERYPLTMLSEQFAHYGMPTDPLAPGETVIGSLGYLLPGSPEGQVQWTFNPLPGSDNWVTVPVPYALPSPTATPEPSPPEGFARVTIDPDDVFVDESNDLLNVGLEIENVSQGVVEVTEDDVLLSSFPDGQAQLWSAAPPLPWTIEPGQRRIFQLQFNLPSADDALLDVLGYSFSIENIGRE